MHPLTLQLQGPATASGGDETTLSKYLNDEAYLTSIGVMLRKIYLGDDVTSPSRIRKCYLWKR